MNLYILPTNHLEVHMHPLPDTSPQDHLFSFCQLFIEHILFAFQDSFRPHLSELQLRTLMCLHEHGPQTMSELADRLLVPRQQMTQVVDRLTQMELVSRLRNEADRRVVRIVWSEQGRREFSAAALRFFDDLYARLHTLSKQDLDDFMRCTDTLRRLLPLIPARPAPERTKKEA